MTAELIHEETRYMRKFVFGLHDKPRLTHPEFHTIAPRRAAIEVDREKEHEPWTLDTVTVSGPRILASGREGASNETHYYTWHGVPDEHAPDWLVTLVADTYEYAERERTGNVPA